MYARAAKEKRMSTGFKITLAALVLLASGIALAVPTGGRGISQQGTVLQAGTGAVLRTIEDRARDTVSVKDFGAVGDGGTDDSDSIQNAIDAAYSNTAILGDYGPGRSVFLPRGVYRITRTIYLKPGVTLSGDGIRTTAIRLIGTTSTDALSFAQPNGTGWANSGIRNMAVISSATQSRDLISYPANHWGPVALDNVITEGAGRYGLYLVGGQEVAITNSRFRISKSAGARIGDGVTGFTTVTFRRVYFDSTTDGPGAEVMSLGSQTVFEDCIFENNGSVTHAAGHGLIVHGGTVSVSHPYIENNGGNGIQAGDATPTWITVVNPIIYGSNSYRQPTSIAGRFDGLVRGGAIIGGKWDGNDSTYTATGTSLWFATGARIPVIGADVGNTPPVWQGGDISAYPAPMFYNDGAGHQTSSFGSANVASLAVSGPSAVTIAPRTFPTGGTVTINASLGSVFYLDVYNGTAFTIGPPSNGVNGQIITVRIRNFFGVMGAVSFDSHVIISGSYANPTNGYARSITFLNDGGYWKQISSSDDVQN
jgi:hypothetical protein